MEVQCLCNHLTSFAAQMLVEPNVIDFRKALRGFVELSENPLVFTLVLSILGVYILLLIWARRRDIYNAKKVHIVSFPFPPLNSLCHLLLLPFIILEFPFPLYYVLHFFFYFSFCISSVSLPPVLLLLLLSLRFTITWSFSFS